MEDMSKNTNEIVEIENEAEVEETSESGGYGVLFLVAAAGAVAGHFIEKGAKAAWSWGKNKIAERKLKKLEDEATAENDDKVVENKS